MNSALYRGRVRHVRHHEVEHAFTYDHVLLALDLAELEQVFARPRWASLERFNLFSFHRRDYLGDPALSLDEAVRRRVAEHTGVRPAGRVLLVGQPRWLGLVFNPVSFYFAYGAADGPLEAIVAEITNTPWGERYSYVLPAAEARLRDGRLEFDFPKRFHVSPFLPMDLAYAWSFGPPGERLDVRMRCRRGEQLLFEAELGMRREPLSTGAVLRALLAQPGLSLRVLAAIYFQALRLRLKGATFHTHPDKRATGMGASTP